MKKSILYLTVTAMVLAGAFTLSVLPAFDRAIQAFTQENLVRVAEVHEVDGQIHYIRVAPVSDKAP